MIKRNSLNFIKWFVELGNQEYKGNLPKLNKEVKVIENTKENRLLRLIRGESLPMNIWGIGVLTESNPMVDFLDK